MKERKTKINSEIGKKIKFALIQQDKKIIEMSKFVGITCGAMSNKIRGRSDWKLQEMKSVCKFLNMSSRELFDIDF